MIQLRKILCCVLLSIVAITIASESHAFIPSNVSAIQYRIDNEWVVIWINPDRSIELHYNITITYESAALGYLTIGLPKGNFEVHEITDISENPLSYTDVSGKPGYSEFGVEVYFGQAMNSGNSGTVLLIATVPNMFSPDQMNPGYWGMQFNTTYYDATVVDLRVAIVPQEGVTQDEIKTMEEAFYTTVDGNFAVYWEQHDLVPNTQLQFGVSIPEQYFTLPGPNPWFYATIVLGIAGIIVVVLLVIRRLRRAEYKKPRISIEALGPRGGLTAVEAAVVVNIKPVRVLTMTLFGLLAKGIVFVEAVEPLLKVREIEVNKGKQTPSRKRYCEIDFLSAIKPDGSQDERRLAQTFLTLRDNVDKKMRGYSRVDTVTYYNSIVEKAWKQVTQANTPQLQGAAIEKNLEWLLVDENYNEKLRNAFPPNIVIVPRLGWYWYWYGPYFPRGSMDSKTIPVPRPSEVKPIPAQEFANRIVSGLEQATNNIVKNVENFANNLIPAPKSSQSSEPVRRGASCVCACAHCACACACVSCACACAGGGAR